MDLGIAGRWGIVCASSQGLGRACADALASEGVHLVVNGRDEEKVKQAASEIQALAGAGDVVAVAADITTPEGREALLAACPRPDILVTNNRGPTPGAAARDDRRATSRRRSPCTTAPPWPCSVPCSLA